MLPQNTHIPSPEPLNASDALSQRRLDLFPLTKPTTPTRSILNVRRSSSTTPNQKPSSLFTNILTHPRLANTIVHHLANDGVLFPFLTLSKSIYAAVIKHWWSDLDFKNPWALDLLVQRLATDLLVTPSTTCTSGAPTALLARLARRVSFLGIKSYAHPTRTGGRFVQCDAMTACTLLLSQTVHLSELHLDLAMVPSPDTLAQCLDSLIALDTLFLRDTSNNGVPIAGNLAASVFAHSSLTHLALAYTVIHYTPELNVGGVKPNIACSLIQSLHVSTHRFALTGIHALDLQSLVFILGLLPKITSITITSANIPELLLNAITCHPHLTRLSLHLPTNPETPSCLSDQPPALSQSTESSPVQSCPGIKHFIIRCAGTLPLFFGSIILLFKHLHTLDIYAANQSILAWPEILVQGNYPNLTSLTVSGDVELGILSIIGIPLRSIPMVSEIHLLGDHQPISQWALMKLVAQIPAGQLNGISIASGIFWIDDSVHIPARPIPGWLVDWVVRWQPNLTRVKLKVANDPLELDLVFAALLKLSRPCRVELILSCCQAHCPTPPKGECRCFSRLRLEQFMHSFQLQLPTVVLVSVQVCRGEQQHVSTGLPSPFGSPQAAPTTSCVRHRKRQYCELVVDDGNVSNGWSVASAAEHQSTPPPRKKHRGGVMPSPVVRSSDLICSYDQIARMVTPPIKPMLKHLGPLNGHASPLSTRRRVVFGENRVYEVDKWINNMGDAGGVEGDVSLVLEQD